MANSRNYSNTSVSTTLNGSITNSGTSVVLTSQTGMPTPPFFLVIDPDTGSEEIVLVNSGAGTSGSPYSVTRGQDGTSGVSHLNLAPAQHRLCALDLTDSRTHEAADTGVHGLNGSNISVSGANSGITSNISLTNTLTETTISKQFTVPASSLVAGSFYQVLFFGTLASVSNPNITWKLKYGTTVVAQAVTTFSTTAGDFQGVGMFTAQTVGASGSVAGSLSVLSPAANTAVASSMPTDTQGVISSVDTTSSKTLLITATWSAASSSNIITVIGSCIQQLW